MSKCSASKAIEQSSIHAWCRHIWIIGPILSWGTSDNYSEPRTNVARVVLFCSFRSNAAKMHDCLCWMDHCLKKTPSDLNKNKKNLSFSSDGHNYSRRPATELPSSHIIFICVCELWLYMSLCECSIVWIYCHCTVFFFYCSVCMLCCRFGNSVDPRKTSRCYAQANGGSDKNNETILPWHRISHRQRASVWFPSAEKVIFQSCAWAAEACKRCYSEQLKIAQRCGEEPRR